MGVGCGVQGGVVCCMVKWGDEGGVSGKHACEHSACALRSRAQTYAGDCVRRLGKEGCLQKGRNECKAHRFFTTATPKLLLVGTRRDATLQVPARPWQHAWAACRCHMILWCVDNRHPATTPWLPAHLYIRNRCATLLPQLLNEGHGVGWLRGRAKGRMLTCVACCWCTGRVTAALQGRTNGRGEQPQKWSCMP